MLRSLQTRCMEVHESSAWGPTGVQGLAGRQGTLVGVRVSARGVQGGGDGATSFCLFLWALPLPASLTPDRLLGAQDTVEGPGAVGDLGPWAGRRRTSCEGTKGRSQDAARTQRSAGTMKGCPTPRHLPGCTSRPGDAPRPVFGPPPGLPERNRPGPSAASMGPRRPALPLVRPHLHLCLGPACCRLKVGTPCGAG